MSATRADPLGCLACPVRDVAVCAGLGDEERRELARLGRRRRFAAGETVFTAGDDSIACATLVTGAVKLSRVDADGVERTLALIHQGGFLARLFATPSDCGATALTDSELCLFPRTEVESRMRAHPGFMERILRATVEQLEASRGLINLIGRRDARARVAGMIAMFAKGGCDGPVVELPLSRGEIAAMLGTTIETVSRQMAALEAAGIITRQGLRGVRIDDPDALTALAG
jgi:CRP/FNR family transcriptional regulator